MSNQNEAGSTHKLASGQESQQKSGEANQHTTTSVYQATYHSYGRNAVPGIYIVQFYPGHTIAKHFAFLGREFEVHSLLEGYWADVDDEIFNAIRCDPGVEFVEDNVSGERPG